jgi:hypothetical protein
MGCFHSKKDVVEPPRYETETVRNMSAHYAVHYPHHEVRKNTALYNKTHASMKHLPCFICGKTNKKDGIHVETHHFYCEKAMQNCYDWKKFAEFATTCHHFQTGNLMGDLFDWNAVAENPDLFVDSTSNMIVLCKEHHTSHLGIHHVPFPEFLAQKFAKDGFVVLSA